MTRPTVPTDVAVRVAVVIPCYNDGPLLLDALRSLEEQEPHELVVVDDGSTDPETLRILAELQATGVRVLRQANGGPAAARMTGVRSTHARYVIPFDADDQLAAGALGALADALDADAELALAWGDTRVFGAEECDSAAAPDLDPWLITYQNLVPVASLIRRSCLVAAGGWSHHENEDWDLWMSFAERGWRGANVGRITLLYRRHVGNRRYSSTLSRYHTIFAELRLRHPALFAARARNWGRSRLPLSTRLLVPLAVRIPGCSPRRREHLVHLAITMTNPDLRWREKDGGSRNPIVAALIRRVGRLRREVRSRVSAAARPSRKE